MARLIGAALLLGGGLWIGLGAAGELGRRVRALDAWIAALTRMENELAFRLPDLPQLLEILTAEAESPAREVFQDVLDRVDELGKVALSALWQETLTSRSGSLNSGDRDVLSRLGHTLGRYGWEDQCRVLEFSRKELETRKAEAQQEWSQKGKARVALGLTAGCFLMILLI